MVKNKLFEVQYLEEDENEMSYGKWISVPLEMCRGNRHCGCYDKEEQYICDYVFYDTDCEQVALDKKESLAKEGLKVRYNIK